MAEFQQLSTNDCQNILERNYFGRLACYSPSKGEAYVVPISYDYRDGSLYFCSREGQKLAYMRENPRGICLLVDEVDNEQSWSSVLATGYFEELAGSERLAQEAAGLRRASGAALHYLFERYSQTSIREVLRLYALRIQKLTGRRERWDWEGPPRAVRRRR